MQTVHLFPMDGDISNGEVTLCCGKTWSQVTKGSLLGSNTYTKDPNLKMSQYSGVWCAGYYPPEHNSKLVEVGVNTKGVKYTVHCVPNGSAICCSITPGQMGAVKGHLKSTDPGWNDESSTMAKCPGWPQGPIITDEALNAKVTCMICGWPRIPEGAGHKDGTSIQEGEVIPQKLYFDGLLVKIFCEKHCDQCGQTPDMCQCCKSCHHYPCKCGQVAQAAKPKNKNSYYATKTTLHVIPPNAEKSLCCQSSKDAIDASSGHDHTEEYNHDNLPDGYKWCTGAANTQNMGPVSGFFFHLPPHHKCYTCGKHMKNCACEAGPVDKNGNKMPLTTGDGLTLATSTMVPGWIDRGQVPVLKQTDADQAWPNMKPAEHDPVEMASDFYLYNAIMSGGVNVAHECEGSCHHNIGQMFALENPPIRAETRILLHELVAEADLVFREYIDMACGGELRHHPSVGAKGVLNGNRSRAWAQWRDVRDLVGVRALLDMADLFVDCNNSTGGVCGQRWQQAALLLYKRLTGQVKPEVFVDQVFSLVHNGGVFLNKREWKNNHLNLLQGTVLPAQARDDFDTLLAFASPTAVAVWDEAWKSINYARIRSGVRPAPRVRIRSISVCDQCGFGSFQGHRTWDCRKSSVHKVKGTDIDYYRSRHVQPHFDWNFKKFWLYEHGNEGVNGPYYRCSLSGPDYVPARKLLDKTVKIPEGKRTLVITDGDYNITKFPITKFKGQEWKLRDLIEIHGLKVSILNQHGIEVNA